MRREIPFFHHVSARSALTGNPRPLLGSLRETSMELMRRLGIQPPVENLSGGRKHAAEEEQPSDTSPPPLRLALLFFFSLGSL